jgi:hypothetical protein
MKETFIRWVAVFFDVLIEVEAASRSRRCKSCGHRLSGSE